jgi:hypothetical protein
VNKGELKTAILAEAHRPDLTAEVDGFVRRAEGMIRRDLVGHELTATLDESDRDSGGIYDLPANLLELRAVFATSSAGTSYAVENCGAPNIRNYAASASVLVYAVRGDQIEFRGVPATDEEIELHYFGHPAALDADGDENDLLTDHEELYLSGALFQLYRFTQDLELAQGALDTFNGTIERLNDAHGRKVGGASNQGAYNFGQNYPSGSSM